MRPLHAGALSEVVEQQLREFARALRVHFQSGRPVKIA
jgi:hypothetical protein